MTNPWISHQRERAFRTELNNNTLWVAVAAMLLSEGDPVPTCESLFNRILYKRSHGEACSIDEMLHSGFYGPINRGALPGFIDRIRRSNALVAQMNTAIETVMAGSDLIHGFTDQGQPTDPNGQRQPQLRIGGNIYNDWGGGPGGHDGAETWRLAFERNAQAQPKKETPPVTTPAPAPVAINISIPQLINILEALKGFVPMVVPIVSVIPTVGPAIAAAMSVAVPIAEEGLTLLQGIQTNGLTLNGIGTFMSNLGPHLQAGGNHLTSAGK